MTARPTLEAILRAPKVLLHDHLDGGLRPSTIVELADESGYDALPTRDAQELGTWMTRGASRKDLVLYRLCQRSWFDRAQRPVSKCNSSCG